MKNLHIVVIVAVSVGVGLTAPYQVDFRYFYDAGRAVLSGVNPYTVAGYYNPLHVAVFAAPLAALPFEVAYRLNAGVMFAVYLVALSRIFRRDVLPLALLAPFGMLIAYYGNIDALVLLGASLPAPFGVWLLLTKPQIGIFAAALMLWKYRDWRLTAGVAALFAVSVALGMLSASPSAAVWNISLLPYGLIVGVPLLLMAWSKRDVLTALGASVFVSPYVTALSWCAALPLFRVNRRVMVVGVVLSWVIFAIWRARL